MPGETPPPSEGFEPASCSRSRFAPEFNGAAGIGEAAAAGADGGSGSSVFGVSRASNAVPEEGAGWPDAGAVPEGSAADDAAPATTFKEDALGAVPEFPDPGLAAFAAPPVAGGTGVAVLGGGAAIAAAFLSPALPEGHFSDILSTFFFPALIPAPRTGVPGDIVSEVAPAADVDPAPNIARTSASAI